MTAGRPRARCCEMRRSMPQEPGGDVAMIEERDISVAMRDGTRLAVDVYRPDQSGKYPVLYAAALHNKDIQGPDIADILPPQPAHAPLWFGPIEAGDTRRFLANGYVHVIAQPRGSAKSEGHYGHEDTDHYDLIEWITQQPWSNGKVGMVGISGYAGEQWRAAAQCRTRISSNTSTSTTSSPRKVSAPSSCNS